MCPSFAGPPAPGLARAAAACACRDCVDFLSRPRRGETPGPGPDRAAVAARVFTSASSARPALVAVDRLGVFGDPGAALHRASSPAVRAWATGVILAWGLDHTVAVVDDASVVVTVAALAGYRVAAAPATGVLAEFAGALAADMGPAQAFATAHAALGLPLPRLDLASCRHCRPRTPPRLLSRASSRASSRSSVRP